MKRFLLYLQSFGYILAGANHFISPSFYFKAMPAWMPWQVTLIQLSGVAEILLGLLLIPIATRKISAWLIIAMLTVFLLLIHVPMLIDYAQRHDPLLWVMILRIPLQLVLIYWAWIYSVNFKPIFSN